jgi:hypothetical protein
MRRAPHVLVVLGLTVVCLLVLPITQGQATHSELTAVWHLDTQAGGFTGDDSGHALLGAMTAGATIVPGGRFGNALDLPTVGPSGSRVNVADAPELESQQLTALMWVKSPGPGTYKWTLAKGAYLCSGASYGFTTGASGGLVFGIVDTAFAFHPSPDAGTGIWDDQWHAVAGTYDGSSLRLYVDGVQVGGGTPTTATIKYDVNFQNLNIGNYPASGPADCNFDYTFPGLIDETRVYTRALNATEIAYLQRADHTTPPNLPVPGPPPPLPPPPPGPAPTPPPFITAVSLSRGLVANAPAVFRADVTGTYNRIQWDLGGKPGLEIVGDPGQNAVRFRPRPSDHTLYVTATAVGPGGASPPVTHVVDAPTRALTGIGGRMVSLVSNRPPVFATSTEPVFYGTAVTSNIGPAARCALLRTHVVSGPLDMDGCLEPITSLGDIPEAERGIVLKLAHDAGIPIQNDAVETAIRLTDAYIAKGPVIVNGVKLTPANGAAIVVYPQVNAIASSNGAMEVGGIKLGIQPNFILNTALQGGGIPICTCGILSGGLTRLAGFGLFGDVKVDLVPPSASAPAGAVITANLRMPEWLKTGGVDVEGQVQLRATTAQGLILQGMTIGPITAQLGALEIDEFKIDYKPDFGGEWHGQGRACVAGRCLDMIPPKGAVVIAADGSFRSARATLEFPPPGLPLFLGLSLHYIGFGLGLDPTRILADAGVTAAGIYDIGGQLVLAFPSGNVPFIFNPDEVGPNFPKSFYFQRHYGPTIAASADASVTVPGLGKVPLGKGYFLYEPPGFVAFGGESSTRLAGVFSIGGHLDGEFNAANGRFNLSGGVDGCILILEDTIIGKLCKGFSGGISNRGLAACVGIIWGDVGIGVGWDPFKVKPYLAGCTFEDYRETQVRGAQAGTAHVVRIAQGDPNRSVELVGADAAPLVRVTGPGGQSVDGTGPLTTSRAIGILRAEKLKTTVVGFKGARAGAYRIELLPGSSALATVGEAKALPAAKVTATISGTEGRRVLRYKILNRPAQRVTFLEVTASGAARTIGTVTGGAGELRFSPAPGRGLRRIDARFELGSRPAERLTVARFSPPSLRLASPRRLHVARRGTSLRVSWATVAGAAQYEVVVSTSNSRQRVVKTRGRRVTVTRIATSSSGRVAARAVASLRSGTPAVARFRATAPRPTRFGKLPKPPKLR